MKFRHAVTSLSSKLLFGSKLSFSTTTIPNVPANIASFPLSFADPSAKAVGTWLLGTAGMVVGMIHIGGLTRLTSSGLSMTTWSPLGTLPPLSLEAWNAEFARYQQYPEWQQRQSMTLSEFQYIYAWEYGHRMLGRCVGLVYVVPWMVLTYRGTIANCAVSQGRLALLGAMGGTQGLVGWWMVKSGLGDDRLGDKNQIKVKPVRLMTHLSMAMATYATLCWTGWDVLRQTSMTPHMMRQYALGGNLSLLKHVRTGSLLITGLTATSIVTGALVAGNDAGRAYNCWPQMTEEGEWMAPEAYYNKRDKKKEDSTTTTTTTSWLSASCDDTATTQFHHRWLGQGTGVAALGLVAYGLSLRRNGQLPRQVQQGLMAMGVATTGQVTLGITTLLHHVPISLAALHQLGSVVVLTSSLYTLHACQSVLKHPQVRKLVTNSSIVRR